MTMKRSTNELQKLVDKFRSDANRVLAKMVTDAFGGAASKPAPKRGGALLQMELETQLSAKAQKAAAKKTPKKAKSPSTAAKKAYFKAWRIRQKQKEGKPLTKSQEKWLKNYDAKRAP